MENPPFPMFMALYLVVAFAFGAPALTALPRLNRRRARRSSERLFPDAQRRQENVQGMYGTFGDVGAGMSRVFTRRVRRSEGKGQPPDQDYVPLLATALVPVRFGR